MNPFLVIGLLAVLVVGVAIMPPEYRVRGTVVGSLAGVVVGLLLV